MILLHGSVVPGRLILFAMLVWTLADSPWVFSCGRDTSWQFSTLSIFSMNCSMSIGITALFSRHGFLAWLCCSTPALGFRFVWCCSVPCCVGVVRFPSGVFWRRSSYVGRVYLMCVCVFFFCSRVQKVDTLSCLFVDLLDLVWI